MIYTEGPALRRSPWVVIPRQANGGRRRDGTDRMNCPQDSLS